MNYLTYPFKYMRITQNYNGSTSHYGHSHGSPADYPVDEGGKDTGRDPMYAPCDLFVRRVWGVGNSGVNTLFVQSRKKMLTPCGKYDYICMQITHENDEDLKKYKAGDLIPAKTVICREGTDGATGNHIHLSVGLGAFVGNCWRKNSKGKYVLTTTNGTLKPEQAFFIDRSFTTVMNAGSIKWTNLPYPVGRYVVEKNVWVRVGAGAKYARKVFTMLTENAREQVKEHNNGKAYNGYVKGVTLSVSDVEYNPDDKYTWGKSQSGWVCLEKCKKI